MALNNITRFGWDFNRRAYILEIGNNGFNEVYEIRSSGRIRYYPWASQDLNWMITDKDDCAFNGEMCFVSVEMVRGNFNRSGEIRKELEQHILKTEDNI